MKALATAAAAATLIVGGAALAGGPSAGAQDSGKRTITLRLKTTGAQPITLGKPGKGGRVPTGDGIVLRLAAYDENDKRVGTAYAECTNVGAPAKPLKAPNQCTQTYVLGGGQIVITGVARFGNLGAARFPVIGGSGAYAGASGEVSTGKPIKGYDSVDVIELEG